MNLTLESDYAIRIVLYIANETLNNKDIRVDANVVSTNTEVTLRFSLKILRKLVTTGILNSYKGLHGGYTLAKDPSDISLREIVETVEGEYAFSRCLLPNKCCCKPENKEHISCKVRAIFSDITNIVNDKLSSTSIKDLLN